MRNMLRAPQSPFVGGAHVWQSIPDCPPWTMSSSSSSSAPSLPKPATVPVLLRSEPLRSLLRRTRGINAPSDSGATARCLLLPSATHTAATLARLADRAPLPAPDAPGGNRAGASIQRWPLGARRTGRLREAAYLRVCADVAAGLVALRAAGWVHRCVSQASVLVVPGPGGGGEPRGAGGGGGTQGVAGGRWMRPMDEAEDDAAVTLLWAQ